MSENLRDASVDDLLTALGDPDDRLRGLAAQHLVRRGRQGEHRAEILARLLPLLADREYLVRAAVASAAVDLGLPTREAIPVLRELLEDEHDFVSRAAAFGLERLGQGTCRELRKSRKRPRPVRPPRHDFYWPSSGHPD